MVIWTLITNVWTWVFLTILRSFVSILEIESLINENGVSQYWTSPFQYVEATLFGVLFGTMFFAVNYLTDKYGLRRQSFGRVILAKSAFYLVSFSIVIVVTYFILSGLGVYPENFLQEIREKNILSHYLPISLVVLGFFVVLINFIIQTSRKFGPHNISYMIRGKYSYPRVEDRVFLFLDLKSSTTYAEKLQHIRYSNLIKDCFHQVNKLVDTYNAEIYQYVGDEVVLTWKTEKAFATLDFIKIYFAFHQAIHAKTDYYMETYGLVPQFKAGINGGEITVAEVGDIKREIAYHGDVINTASRIQGQCNIYHKKLLISGDFLDRLQNLEGYRTEYLGEIPLRGKKSKVDIFSIEEAQETTAQDRLQPLEKKQEEKKILTEP